MAIQTCISAKCVSRELFSHPSVDGGDTELFKYTKFGM